MDANAENQPSPGTWASCITAAESPPPPDPARRGYLCVDSSPRLPIAIQEIPVSILGRSSVGSRFRSRARIQAIDFINTLEWTEPLFPSWEDAYPLSRCVRPVSAVHVTAGQMP
jgi:hypothetical protein